MAILIILSQSNVLSIMEGGRVIILWDEIEPIVNFVCKKDIFLEKVAYCPGLLKHPCRFAVAGEPVICSKVNKPAETVKLCSERKADMKEINQIKRKIKHDEQAKETCGVTSNGTK